MAGLWRVVQPGGMTWWAPGGAANTANCNFVEGDLTDGGSYTAAASPNSTFDQGGNVFEWNEAIVSGSGRGLRGGFFDEIKSALTVLGVVVADIGDH